jgi:superfamily II DNA or RNA helicase
MKSLSREAFASVVEDVGIPDNTLLIVDEVHNIGAPSYRAIMRQDIIWRLGLSATPKRHFDEIGTDAIYDYFHQVVYTYDLAQALKDKRLSPYIYDIYPAYMSDDEYEQYRALTVRIVRMRSKQNKEITYQTDNLLDGDDYNIEKLLFERARIIKKCAEKNKLIEDILNQYPPTKCLVYCADHDQLKAISDGLNDRNIIHLSYTSHQSNKERKDALNALANGVTGILLAIDCLDEGVDVPSVNQAVILASSTNMRQFIQRRGRILRRSIHKNRATLVDVIVLPPKSVGHEGKHMLFGELARAKEMASLAENDVQILNKIATLIQPYGILFSEFITGESYE